MQVLDSCQRIWNQVAFSSSEQCDYNDLDFPLSIILQYKNIMKITQYKPQKKSKQLTGNKIVQTPKHMVYYHTPFYTSSELHSTIL